MLKSKINKLFLIFGVILFSLVGVVGCSNQTVNATYISTNFEEDIVEGQFDVLNYRLDLINTLKNDAPEIYDDNFFESNSLLAFKIVESSAANKSEIKSYEIIDKTLNVYVKTKKYKDTADIRHWWFILELDKDEVNTVEYVSIFKNDEKIMSNSYRNLSKEAIQCYFDKYIKDKRDDASIEDIRLFEYFGTYGDNFVGVFLDKKDCDFPEVLQSIIVNGLVFSYSYGYDILVYSNSIFYLLDESFDKKILTSTDIEEIYKLRYDSK